MTNSYHTILDKLSKVVETDAKYKVEDVLYRNLLMAIKRLNIIRGGYNLEAFA